MLEYKGFRADRLREAMEENGAHLEDILHIYEEYSNIMTIKNDYRLIDILNEREIPSIKELFLICKAVNCSADYLLGLSDEMY